MRFRLYTCLILICLAFAGCSEKPATEPALENAEKRDPRFVSQVPRTMDLTGAQNDHLLVAAGANAPFILRKRSSAEKPLERGSIEFDAYTVLNGKTLKGRGVTVRKYEVSTVSLLSIYTVAYYVDANQPVDQEIPDTEQALILHYQMDVPKEKVVQAIKDNVRENPKVDIAKVEPLFNQLADAFDSPQKGDRYEFNYIPGKGTAMIKRGKILTVVPTFEFAQAFFGIWLSPHGKDVEMRCDLLALPCPKNKLNPVNLISNPVHGAKEKLGKLKNLVS